MMDVSDAEKRKEIIANIDKKRKINGKGKTVCINKV